MPPYLRHLCDRPGHFNSSVDVGVFALLSCHPFVGAPPPLTMTPSCPSLVVCRHSYLICTTRHLALHYVMTTLPF